MAQRREPFILVSRLHLCLAEGGVEQGQALMLLDQLAENLLRLFGPAARGEGEPITVLHTQRVLAVVNSRDELLRDVGVGIGRNHPHALAKQLVGL